jgi:dienelactone hydrolase
MLRGGLIRLFAAGLVLLLAQPVFAADVVLASELNETIVKLPISVNLRDGTASSGEMLLTTYKPTGPGPFPIAIINHGRNLDRSTPERFRMLAMASYLVYQGFAVFVPTRLGYGGAALPIDQPSDPEDSGNCIDKDYVGAVGPAVQQIAEALTYARKQRYVDPTRHLVIGQSTGGFASVAYAAGNPSGLIGYVNFAGGVGGDPLRHPGVPCQPERIARAYGDFGKTTRVPNLWIYTENDQYFAPRYSRSWHRAFAAGGSPSQFVLQEPFGEDGHRLMGEGRARWNPLLDDFLVRVGMRLVPPPMPHATGYATIFDLGLIPWLNPAAKARGYTRFLTARPPRAFAISEAGYWGWANGPHDTISRALAHCNHVSPKPCVLYAIDDIVVWRAPAPDSAAAQPTSPDKPAMQQSPRDGS